MSPDQGLSNPFFDHPILNSPYAQPRWHWELDASGQPTQKIIESRRRADFITPIPKPTKRRAAPAQQVLVFDEGKGLSTATQQYDPTSIINEAHGRDPRLDRLDVPTHAPMVSHRDGRDNRADGIRPAMMRTWTRRPMPVRS